MQVVLVDVNSKEHDDKMSDFKAGYKKWQFDEGIEFIVPERYTKLTPKGVGAQGTVW